MSTYQPFQVYQKKMKKKKGKTKNDKLGWICCSYEFSLINLRICDGQSIALYIKSDVIQAHTRKVSQCWFTRSVCIHALWVYTRAQGVYTRSGCIHALRVYTRAQGVYTRSGCIHALRVYTRAQGVYTRSVCIHALSVYTRIVHSHNMITSECKSVWTKFVSVTWFCRYARHVLAGNDVITSTVYWGTQTEYGRLWVPHQERTCTQEVWCMILTFFMNNLPLLFDEYSIRNQSAKTQEGVSESPTKQ